MPIITPSHHHSIILDPFPNRTTELSMPFSDEDKFRFDRIKHENDLMNHRITWFITLQGLLFAALGFAWDKADAKPLIIILSFLGIFTSASSALVLWGGASAIEELLKEKPTNMRHRAKHSEKIIEELLKEKSINMGRRAKQVEKLLYPWYTFPVVFILAWVTILFSK